MRKEGDVYHLVYDTLFAPGGSYWFPCDAGGNLLPFPLASFHANMERIKKYPGDFGPPRVELQRRSPIEDVFEDSDHAVAK
jgi:hypothetical protein